MKYLNKIWDYFLSFKGELTEGQFLLHLLDPIFFIAMIISFSISLIAWGPIFADIKIFDLPLTILLFAGGLILLTALFTMNLLSIFIRRSKTEMSIIWLYYYARDLIKRPAKVTDYTELFHSKRILLQGSSGAGKSTLAIELDKLLSLPVIHMDKEYWQPDWKKPNSEEWHQKQLNFIQNEKWIIEGGAYQRALPFRVLASDFVIYLEFNRFLCLYRCYKRYFTTRGKNRPDMPLGCVDQVDFAFIKWILHEQPMSASPLALKTIKENLKHKNLVVLKSPSQVKIFLNEIKSHQREKMEI